MNFISFSVKFVAFASEQGRTLSRATEHGTTSSNGSNGMGERRDGIYWSKTESSEAHSPLANRKQDIGASDRNLVRFETTASNRSYSSLSAHEVKTNFG